MELYAKIKKTSKYAYQGEDERGKPRLLPVREIQDDAIGGYHFRLPGNQYRLCDLNLYVKTPGGKLVKLGR
jgi:hypothetical protein